ncbi:MAG: PAS domain S-box protein [Verrucomicrobiae bacterium]|nr:PAS domain S-box protein [Verrucomicrobiae bacterium]
MNRPSSPTPTPHSAEAARPSATPTPHSAEAARLAAMHEYPICHQVPGTGPSEACRIAALLCHRPIAAVEFILQDTVVIAASAGLHVGTLRREDALSPLALDATDLVVIPDTFRHPRCASLRLVRAGRGVRFYAAVPLATPEGAVLGVLSVWDHVPGHLTPVQSESLEGLGRMVMAQLNLGRRQRQLEALETQHAEVEAALREAESKFRGIFEHTVVGIYQTTADGRYLSANPMLARIYGYDSPEELIASVNDIQQDLYVDPAARDRFVQALRQQDTIANFEARIRRKDGSVIWIAENARVVRDPRGEVRFYEGTVQDITARKLAEEQLRTSEMLYHSLVEDLPQNVFRKDAAERFIFANSRFCQTIERPIDRLLGCTDFDLFPPELARKYQADDQRVMAEGRTLRETERNVTPDGTVHWVEVIKTPLRDPAGRVVGIQGIFWDVTERKRLQDALAYEHDLLQALLDHSPDIIYFKDPKSRFSKVGRALARRFGISDPDDLIGKTAFDLLQPELARIVHAEEQEILRRGEPIVNQVDELVDHRGRRSWASVTKVPIYNRAGEILGLVGVARDITKLIETEQALREAEEKYRAIFENSVEGIYQTSPEGRFLQVNPSLARIYGYASPDEVIQHLTDVRTQVYVQPSRREEFVRAVLDAGSITGFESEIYRRDGTRIWISESARLVRDREGRLAFFEGTVEDISVRKQIEAEQEKARQAALESARLKSEFVATVSHEIRTPLNAILPNTDRLLDSGLDRQQLSLVENIRHGAHMLLQIVNDILDRSKLEAGAVTLESIDFDVHEVIERTLNFFASHAHAKRLELVGHIHPDVPHRLRGDPGRLAQILNNLLGNAIKFTPSGEVALEASACPRNHDSIDLQFQVRDTGIGIAPDAHDRVFQAFAQGDGSMTRRYGGTGLGLAITRGFVELMGGSIDFTSQLGQGTTFRVQVRLQLPPHPVPTCLPPPLLDGLRVLVLDDNASQRRVIADSLRQLHPAQITQSESIAAAVHALRQAARTRLPFDLVLFDADLPGSSTLQTARRLRVATGSRTRLVALLPPGTVSRARGFRAAGLAGTLNKPLRQSRLPLDLQAIFTGLSEPAPQPPARPVAEPRPGAGLKVLIVEDQDLNQRVASDLLQRLGARVVTAATGPDAIRAFSEQPFDLILMDCQMPEMDGYEATRRIRNLERQRPSPHRIPIVALSANALHGDRERGLQAGMDDYLTKPLLVPELIRILQNVARRQAPSRHSPTPSATPPPLTEPDLPVLDPEPLRSLASPDDPRAADDFIRQFLLDAPAILDRLESALAEASHSRLRTEAHRLKGSSGYMGAQRLVEACARLEADSRDALPDDATQSVARIRSEFDAARLALENVLAHPPATP